MGRLAVTVVLVCAAACSKSQEAVTARTRPHMGTHVTITVAARESGEVLGAIEAGFREVRRLEALLSGWKPDNPIAEVNRQAGKEPVGIGAELFSVVRLAHRVSVDSGGAFDVTFAALGGLWDFKSPEARIPTEEDLRARAALVDFRQVELDEAAGTIRLRKEGMRIGLGGIAKGYVVDRVSTLLKDRGYPDHLVVAGGDLFASGTKHGKPWNVGIRDPSGEGLAASFGVRDRGVATSGNYEKFFVRDGVRYHHILDPATGRPARGLSSVTVVAGTAAEADAWATALFVLGKERAMAEAAERGLEAYLFDEGYQTSATPGLRERVQPVKR
jgi:thiamine biosynthesis lipoprotein